MEGMHRGLEHGCGLRFACGGRCGLQLAESFLIMCDGNGALSLLLRSSRSRGTYTCTHTQYYFLAIKIMGEVLQQVLWELRSGRLPISFSIKPKPFVKVFHHMGPPISCSALFCTVLQLMPPAPWGPLSSPDVPCAPSQLHTSFLSPPSGRSSLES